jgi:hypothetical protein
MPKLYAKHHDQFIENYLNLNDFNAYIKDRVVYCKNKSGYIAPANL